VSDELKPMIGVKVGSIVKARGGQLWLIAVVSTDMLHAGGLRWVKSKGAFVADRPVNRTEINSLCLEAVIS
jgi:hypothetical protein